MVSFCIPIYEKGERGDKWGTRNAIPRENKGKYGNKKAPNLRNLRLLFADVGSC
jgi:hypothetical protein